MTWVYLSHLYLSLRVACAVPSRRRPAGVYEGRRFTTDAGNRDLNPLLVDLNRRGFSAADGRKLGLKAFGAEEALAQLPQLSIHRAGIRIPYFDLRGKPIAFYRYRFFDPPLWGPKRRPIKYIQESASKSRIYLPPLVDWEAIGNDPNVTIYVTEGEFKAAYMTKLGFPTISIGGVWSFRSAKQNRLLLSEFDEFNLQGRTVYIIFDSDAADKPQIKDAASALARELTQRGAVPWIGFAPSLDLTAKTGPDDFLLARGEQGKDSFRKEVLDRAKQYEAARALFELNEEVIYIKTPPIGIIVRRDDGAVMSHHDFTQHAYATYRLIQTRENKITEKSAAVEWIKWPFRATAERLTYAPGEAFITDKNEVNEWPGWGCQSKKGNVEPFLELFNFLTTALSREERMWLLQWFAYPLQYPGTKLATAVVVWGTEQGTGKSLLANTMAPIYGEIPGKENFFEIKDGDLKGDFNTWAARRQFVFGDEITAGEHGKKRDLADRMKAMITRQRLTINEKHKPIYQLPDTINYFFASQHADAFFLEDGDRRYFICEVVGPPMEYEFYTRYVKWLQSQDGPAALFHYLLQVDTSKFEPHARAPVTAAKLQMIEDGRSAIEIWVASVKANPAQTLKSEATLWTAKDLLSKYDPEGKTNVTVNTLSRKLKAQGFSQWGKRGFRQARPVKELNDRVWIISKDVGHLARLQDFSEKQIYALYREQRQSNFSRPVPLTEI